MSTKSALLPVTLAYANDNPDRFVVAPVQFFPQVPRSPEQALVLALLEDLVVCLIRESRGVASVSTINHLTEDLDYLQGVDQDNPLSFDRCCAYLGLDPRRTRKAILAKLSDQSLSIPSAYPRRHKTAEYSKNKLND